MACGLAAITLLQWLSGRQKLPHFTNKTSAVLLLSFGCAFFASVLCSMLVSSVASTLAVGATVLGSPLFVVLAWAVLLPEDSRRKKSLLQRATDLRASLPQLTVIGITGSVGKTTTKTLLAELLADRAVATPAHVNTELGVAQWFLQAFASSSAPFAIVEMGAYRRGEISTLCHMLQPSIGAITYIGNQHTALFGSLEAVAQAKSELIASLPKTGTAVLNADCAPCLNIAERTAANVVTVGQQSPASLQAQNVTEEADGLYFQLSDARWFAPLHGKHNLTNVLIAIAICRLAGLADEEIQTRLAQFRTELDSFTVRSTRNVTVVDDTYNSSPMSVLAATHWAASQPHTHKVLVLAGLLEQGSFAKQVHEDIGREARQTFARVICLNKKFVPYISLGYGKDVEMISKKTVPVPAGTLLVCCGRMSEKTIDSLLP